MSEVQKQTTPGIDLLCVAFTALTAEEQADALRRCQSIWLRHESERGSKTAQIIASLTRVAEVLGSTPGIEDYKRL